MRLFKVFLNSLFLQSAWSFEKMQSLGFAFSVLPALKKIYRDKDEFLSALKRHMEFFNTQPYMAAPIIGASIKLEEDVKAGTLKPEDVSLFKRSLMGPYAAIGDSYFWGSLKPMAAVLGAALSMLSIGLWGGIVFLIVYNIPHLWMRINGLAAGYRMGMDVTLYIKSLDIPEWGRRLKYFTICLLGIALALYYIKIERGLSYSYILLNIAGIFGSIIFLAWLMRNGLSASRLVYIIFAMCIVYFYIAPYAQDIIMLFEMGG